MKRARVYAWAIVALTAVVVALLFRDPVDFPPPGSIVFWIVLIGAIELLPVSLGFGTEVTMSFPASLALALVYRHEPAVVMLMTGAAAFDIRELRRQIPIYRALFNRAQKMLSIGVATLPFWLVGARADVLDPLLVGSGALLHILVNLALVAGAVHLEQRITFWHAFRELPPRPIAGFAISYVLLTGLGAATAVAYTELEHAEWAVAAILVPLVFARLSLLGARAREDLAARIQEQQQALLSLADEVFRERERERDRIAAGIHDSSLQMLAATSYGCSNAEQFLNARDLGAAKSALATAQQSLGAAIDGLRASIRDLKRSAVEEGGLAESVRQFAEQAATFWGADVHVSASLENVPSAPLAVASFQIVQEGLVNALKHANADKIKVEIEDANGRLRIVVEDDGVGFDPAAAPPDSHVGLGMMRERVSLVGGELNIDSAPAGGTRLEVVLPSGLPS